VSETLERATMRTVSFRLLPVLFVLYIAAFLDRTNLGLAALQMNHDVGLSSAAYGFGAGVFFIGYGLFEVPSNVILARVGARRWIARIAFTWGIIACAMMFVHGTTSFYVLRFLLGAAEAGCFPGIVYYLSEWFPERQRASAMSRFMVSIPLSGAIGGPLGGALLSLNGHFGLAGWQWLFLVEGLPSIALGVAVLFLLPDRPADAHWLRDDQRTWLTKQLASERAARASVSEARVGKALTSGIVWWFAVLYLLVIAAELGPVFFGPVLVADALHLGSMGTGLVMGAIGLAGVVSMLLNGAHSDRTGERIAHTTIPMLLMAIGFAISALSHSGAMVIFGLALISFGVNAFLPVFWCLPSTILTGSAAAGGIALINSIGNLGGFFAPNILGLGKAATGSYTNGLLTLGCLAFIAALMILCVRRVPAFARRAPATIPLTDAVHARDA
jgi:ACS family tartrate transporter-like MFS transporter